jgi:hypothetical protein
LSARTDSISDARDGQVCGRQPQKEQMHVERRHSEPAQPGRKGSTRKRRLEGEADALVGEPVQASEHHSAGGDRRALWIESR